MSQTAHNCPLCTRNKLIEIWADEQLRVIAVDDPDFPGFTRVVWHDHIGEMTDLDETARQHIMNVVWQVERVMRNELTPHKVNLASLGNQVPHLHWHVIPRWRLDSRFPDPVWAPSKTRSPEQELAWSVFGEQQANLLADYHHALRQALDALPARA
jgi:diadenosine tetraphosphate (Ap4A) HIT family hydrolase